MKSFVALVVGVFIGVPVLSGVMRVETSLLALGQDPNTSVMFEVAAVRPNKSGQIAAQIDDQPGGRFTATNATLRQLILEAYRIPGNQLVDAPDWTQTERFDVNAKLEHESPIAPRGQPGERQFALRSLLEERFKLVVHRETRQFPMYALVIARADRKLGPMLKPSKTDCSPETMEARFAAAQAGKAVSGVCGSLAASGRLQFGGKSLSEFAKGLSSSRDVDRPVIDRTGLTGNWDIDLTFTPDRLPERRPGQEPPAADPLGPSLFIALQEQLGLKLESIRDPMEVLVVDHVERLDVHNAIDPRQ